MKYAVGFDIGGTNIRCAIVDELGNILKVIKEPTRKVTCINDLYEQIIDLFNKVNDGTYKFEGIGLGLPGPFTSDGTCYYLVNLGIDIPFNPIKDLKDRINLPIYVGNDADVAGLCESKVGAGKGFDVVQYITISTGIGGGLIINGKIRTGKTGQAQEVGSMIVKINGRAPSKFKPSGSIEGEASGRMLTIKANELGLNVKHSGELFDLAYKDKNKVAIELVSDWLQCMGAFISSIVNYMEPDVFVLGGGVMKSSDLFMEDLIKHIDDYLYESLKGKVLIKKAMYDQDCGIIGAAMLCL